MAGRIHPCVHDRLRGGLAIGDVLPRAAIGCPSFRQSGEAGAAVRTAVREAALQFPCAGLRSRSHAVVHLEGGKAVLCTLGINERYDLCGKRRLGRRIVRGIGAAAGVWLRVAAGVAVAARVAGTGVGAIASIAARVAGTGIGAIASVAARVAGTRIRAAARLAVPSDAVFVEELLPNLVGAHILLV